MNTSKKFLIFSIIIVVFFTLGCSLPWFKENKEIASISFRINDGTTLPQFYFESSLNVTPNYKNRTLNVTYSLTYPYRTEETIEEDFSASGDVGGDFFDRYLNVVDYFDRDLSFDQDCTDYIVLSVNVENKDKEIGKKDYNLCGFDENRDIVYFKEFFDDIANVLKDNIY